MKVLLIFAFVHLMEDRRDEVLQVNTMLMDAKACAAHVEKALARYSTRGRWSQSYRYFHMRCVPVTAP